MRDGQGWIVLSVSTANLCNCMANREDGPVFSQVEKKEDPDGVKGGTTATMSRHQSCPKAALSRMA
jgi:hypothetical protein